MICLSVPVTRPCKQSFLLLPDGRKPSEIPEHLKALPLPRELLTYGVFQLLKPSVAQRESEILPSEFLMNIPSHLPRASSGRLGGLWIEHSWPLCVSTAWECVIPGLTLVQLCNELNNSKCWIIHNAASAHLQKAPGGYWEPLQRAQTTWAWGVFLKPPSCFQGLWMGL